MKTRVWFPERRGRGAAAWILYVLILFNICANPPVLYKILSLGNLPAPSSPLNIKLISLLCCFIWWRFFPSCKITAETSCILACDRVSYSLVHKIVFELNYCMCCTDTEYAIVCWCLQCQLLQLLRFWETVKVLSLTPVTSIQDACCQENIRYAVI